MGGVPITFRSEPVLDMDLCYLVHSPLLLITAENRTENEFGRLAGGSFPMLIGELRARSSTNALQRRPLADGSLGWFPRAAMIEHRGWLVVLEQLLFRSYCSCSHHHLAEVGTRKKK